MKEKDLVVHHNYLNESILNLTELELNLFIIVLYKMRREDEERVLFDAKEIKMLVGAKDKSYKAFEKLTHTLQDKTLYLKTMDGYKRIKPFPTLYFNNKKKTIEIGINRDMIPFFKELKEQFTQYSLKEFLNLKSKHSKRLYQLLKQYENIGKRSFEVKQLKNYLECDTDSYARMYNFEKRVLNKAKEEINENTSLSVDYEKIKSGRAIKSLDFSIEKSDKTTLSDYKDTPSDKLVNLKLDIGKISKTKDLSDEIIVETKGIKKEKTTSSDYKDTPSDKLLKKGVKVKKIDKTCGKEEKKAAKKKVIKKDKTTPSDYKDTLSDKLEKAIIKARRNIYVSKAWNKRADNKISKIINENGEEYALDILNRLYVSVKKDIKTTLVQYINGIMKNIRIEVKEKTLSNLNKAKEEKVRNEKEIKGNNLLPKENKEELRNKEDEITLEEFEELDEKTRNELEKEAIKLTMKKGGISEKFLSDLKKRSFRIYFNTIKANIKKK